MAVPEFPARLSASPLDVPSPERVVGRRLEPDLREAFDASSASDLRTGLFGLGLVAGGFEVVGAGVFWAIVSVPGWVTASMPYFL